MSDVPARDRGPAAIFLAALLWSTGGLFIKEVSLDAWAVSLWRSSFAAVAIFSLYQFRKSSFAYRSEYSWMRGYIWLVAFFYALLLLLFVLATKLTTSANAIFLQYTAPVYVLFIEPRLTHRKLKTFDVITVIVTIAAMGLFFVGKFETRSLVGNIAALLSGVAFAIFTLLLKHGNTGEEDRWRAVIIGHVLIAVSMIVVTSLLASPIVPSGSELWKLSYLGIVQIGIAYGLFTYGIEHVRALDASLLSMIEPVLNPVWVFLGVGERPTDLALVGGAVIVGMVITRTIVMSRKIKMVP